MALRSYADLFDAAEISADRRGCKKAKSVIKSRSPNKTETIHVEFDNNFIGPREPPREEPRPSAHVESDDNFIGPREPPREEPRPSVLTKRQMDEGGERETEKEKRRPERGDEDRGRKRKKAKRRRGRRRTYLK